MGSLQQRQRDSSAYQAAVAARAATGAAAANLRKRCNQCEACLTSQVTHHTCASYRLPPPIFPSLQALPSLLLLLISQVNGDPHVS